MDKQALDIPRIGVLPSGPLDSICDVGEITVGHCTLADGPLQTGVTVVRPHGGDPFLDKTPAAATVLNGFGKSTGLVQVQELGVLETPIALTNTFGVGTAANAQIRAAVATNPGIGRGMATVNPLVFECNDGFLNDIQRMAVPVDLETVAKLWSETMSIALRFDLTPYDAAYVELAGRLRLPLFSYDRKLSSAAESAGVELL